jgi:uncharacterized RmlC-like cupin family protein
MSADGTRFDQLSRALAETNARRSLVETAAALAAASVPALRLDAAAARREPGVHAEHFRHRKRWYCLSGKSARRYRRKLENLLAMGATPGKCQDAPPKPTCVPKTCEELGLKWSEAPDGCGGTPQCGACPSTVGDNPACCAGQCVDLDWNNDTCGSCGNVCPDNAPCGGGNCN